MQIKKVKVDALFNHLNGGGGADPDSVAEVLGIESTDTETMQAYMRAVNKRAGEKTSEPSAEVAETPTVIFRNADNTLEELEVVRVKDSRIIVQKSVKRDLVKIMVAGKSVEVDCEKLRALPAGDILQPFGVSVSTLLVVAALAR